VENLHWIDATSEEFLASLVGSLGGASIVLVATYRSGYRPAWLDKSYTTQLALPRLDPQESLAVVQSVPQMARIPIAVQQAMVQTAGGNPFFLEELTWALVEQSGDASPPAVPATVQAVLAARIDRLAPAAKRLLQTAAVIGQAVPLGLLAALADDANDAEVLQSLEQLQRAEFLYETQVGAEQVYTFKHVLTQEVAYGSLLLARRQTLHARVAQVLTTQYPETVATQPERLAHHYTEAGRSAQAIGYWHRAAAHAIQRSAYVEALRHLSTARTVLTTLPETRQRAQLELDVLMLLGSLHMARTHGFPLFVGANLLLQGWALAMQMHGRATEALAQMEQGLAMSQATGHRVFYPWNLALLAEAYGQAGQCTTALTVVAEALTIVDTTEERMWEAELHRLKGEICLAQAAENHAVAAACWQRAFVVARRQHAKSWELRAAMRLARLWQGQGKRAEAFELLAPIYGWFTEGFDAPDLQDARVLLDALGD
jgi:predicted ATPase